MTGNLNMNNSYINFETADKGIQQYGKTYLRNTGADTVLSTNDAANKGKIYFRPQGNENNAGEVAIDTDGTIVPSNHIIPKAGSAIDLGSDAFRWRNGYFYENINLNGDVEFATDNKGIKYNGTTILRNNGTSTVLSSKTAFLYLRPNGDNNATGEFVIHTDGAAVADGNVRPKTDNTRELGTTGFRWNNTWTNNINGLSVGGAPGNRWGTVTTVGADGVLEIGHHLHFHTSDGSIAAYAGRIYFDKGFAFSNHLFPDASDQYNVGNSTRRWRSAYFSGNVTAAAHVNNSERDLKDNIKEFDSNEAYEAIKNLNIYTYNYKERPDSGLEIKTDEDGNVIPHKSNKKKPKVNTRTQMGIMVDEAPEVIVSEDKTGVDIYGFTSYLASAFKTAINKIEELEKELAQLKTQP